ncbi:type II RES/Xre toxin-antitoxin system antitoxin [Paraburkholderia humisilvae]|uniref:type II RES/Xre toxin-antitoxin system antitoxin n=1 Tax=Paraburkholderia humisilvae TaxID=627669 RepID=UPI0035EAFB65
MATTFIPKGTGKAGRPARAVPAVAAARRPRQPNDLYVWVFKADPLERIDLIKEGVDATTLVSLASSLHTSKDQLFKRLGLPRATVDRKARNNENLSQDQSERVIGLMKLIGQVRTVVEQSGDPTHFDAAQWVGRWIEKPNHALGGRVPAELMDTVEGQELVAGLIAKMQSGAYA